MWLSVLAQACFVPSVLLEVILGMLELSVYVRCGVQTCSCGAVDQCQQCTTQQLNGRLPSAKMLHGCTYNKVCRHKRCMFVVLTTCVSCLQAPMWQQLPDCLVPVLLVAGTEDPKFINIHRKMMAALTNKGSNVADRQPAAGAQAAAQAAAEATTTAASRAWVSDTDASELPVTPSSSTAADIGSISNDACIQVNSVIERALCHTVVEVPDAGHAVHVEAPVELLAALRSFLSCS